MKTRLMLLTGLAMTAGAQGASWPNVWGEMEHVLIGMPGGVLDAHVEHPDVSVELRAFPGETYDGAAGVLDGKSYSSQYGWLANGFISLNAGETIMIENVGSTPGLEVYHGGMRMDRPNHTYAPIFGTAGSDAATAWEGMMRHDWFAVDALGEYEATFRVYVVDAAGEEVAGYGDSEVTLSFIAVPAPGGLAVIGLAGVFAARRRRGGGAR